MSSQHPSDLELFEYVEGELAEEDAAAVRTHLETCAACAADAAAAERGRAALQGAQILEPRESAWRQALGSLGSQDRDRRRWTPGRLAAVLVPAAAVVAAVVAVAIVTTGDEPSGEAAETAAALESAAADQAAGGGEAGRDTGTGALETAAAPVREVAGPPEEVVTLLEEAGLTATVVAGTVEVGGGATAAEVTEALESRADGSVPVLVVP